MQPCLILSGPHFQAVWQQQWGLLKRRFAPFELTQVCFCHYHVISNRLRLVPISVSEFYSSSSCPSLTKTRLLLETSHIIFLGAPTDFYEFALDFI